MEIKAVLFDLDGTLLPMDQKAFLKIYFEELAKALAPHGYEPKSLVDALWSGIFAMIKNDGSRLNETVFWEKFAESLGQEIYTKEEDLDHFYRNEYMMTRTACRENPMARIVLDKVKGMGLTTVLATNPCFPAIATETRMSWVGLQPQDFTFVTTYENSSFCKPNPRYYLEILEKLGLKPEECLMVGNDVSEDMVAADICMKVFLLTDCILNRENKDISGYPSGGYPELLAYLDTLSE